MELLWSFLDVISIWILTCMRQILLYPPYGQGSWEILQQIKYENSSKRKENTLRIINMLSTFIPLLKQKTWQIISKQIEKYENLARSIWIILLTIYVKISKCTRFWKRFLEYPKSPFLWRIDLFPLAD